MEVFRSKPSSFHWGLGTVQEDFLPAFERDRLADFLAEIRAESFSFDLGPACGRNQFILPLSPILDPDEILSRSGKVLDHVRRVYSGRLAVENYNYYPTGLVRACLPAGFHNPFPGNL